MLHLLAERNVSCCDLVLVIGGKARTCGW